MVTRRAYSVLLQVLLYRRLADVEAAAADPTVTRPMQYAVHVENKHRVSVIKEQLSELSGIPAAWLQLADVYKGKFHQVRYAVLVTHHCDTWRLLSQAICRPHNRCLQTSSSVGVSWTTMSLWPTRWRRTIPRTLMTTPPVAAPTRSSVSLSSTGGEL